MIPFEYVADNGKLEKIKFPEELRLYQNIGNWQSSFELEEVFLPEFLAQQLSRRGSTQVFSDERIENSLGKVKPEFSYDRQKGSGGPQKGRFVFKTSPPEKDALAALETSHHRNADDVNYYLSQILQLAGKVLHQYEFKDFSGIQVQVPFADRSFFLSPNDLDKIRKKKLDMDTLVAAAK